MLFRRWRLLVCGPVIPIQYRPAYSAINCFELSNNHPDTMVYALSKFISIPSVSSIPFHREDCRQAAIWLKKCLSQLGAQSTLVCVLSLLVLLLGG